MIGGVKGGKGFQEVLGLELEQVEFHTFVIISGCILVWYIIKGIFFKKEGGY